MAILSNGHLLSDPERPRHETTRLRDGPFLGMEVGITHPPESAPVETKLALGLWKNAADFKDFNAIQRKSVNGAYLIGEKPLYKRNDATRGLAGFFQVGVAQGDRTRIAHYLGTGLTYQGPFASRADDIVGLGVARASNGTEFLAANPGLLRAETTLELTYKAKFAGDLTLRPDLQYVINPGTDPALDNALLVYFRLQKTF
jgi:porin